MQNHITVGSIEGRPIVEFDDYELQDWFDDIFTEEYGICYEYRTDNEEGPFGNYIMHFSADVSEKKLTEIVNSIAPEEINKVWALNNTVDGRIIHAWPEGEPIYVRILAWFKGLFDKYIA